MKCQWKYPNGTICGKDVLPIADKSRPSTRSYDPRINEMGGTWNHPTSEDPTRLCYYHRKKRIKLL